MSPLGLVKKVTALGRTLVVRRPDAARPAQAGRSFASRATVRLLHATTKVAQAMQTLPVPPARAGERVALSAAAAQLRAMAGGAIVVGGAARDPSTLEGALAELVGETLALVDKLLAEPATLPREPAASKELPRATDERDEETGEIKKVRF